MMFVLVSGSDLLKHRGVTHSLNVITHHQWFRFAQTLESDSLPRCIFTCSMPVVQICSKTDSQTRCMFTHTNQWFWSTQKRESNSQTGCSPILISGFESLEDWRATHSLDVCSPLLVVLICSRSMTRERLTAWMHVHHLVSISDPLNYWRTTHSLHFILVSGSDLLKH